MLFYTGQFEKMVRLLIFSRFLTIKILIKGFVETTVVATNKIEVSAGDLVISSVVASTHLLGSTIISIKIKNAANGLKRIPICLMVMIFSTGIFIILLVSVVALMELLILGTMLVQTKMSEINISKVK